MSYKIIATMLSVLGVCASLVPPAIAQLDTRDARELLRSCAEARQRLRDVRIVGTTRLVQSGSGTSPRNVNRELLEFELIRHRGAASLRSKVVALTPEGAEDTRLEVFVQANDGRAMEYEAAPSRPPRFASVYDRGAARLETLLQSERYQGPLGGYLGGNDGKAVDELLLDAADLRRAEDQHVQDIRCAVLVGNSSYGRVEVWIAPERDFSIMRLSIAKEAHHLHSGRPIADPPRRWRSLTAKLDGVEIEQVRGLHVPIRGVYTADVVLQDGRTTHLEVVFRRTQVTPDPDVTDLGIFRLDLPDGTPTFREDAPEGATGLEFEWREGRVVVAHDPRVTQTIDSELARAPAAVTPAVKMPAPAASPELAWLLAASAALLTVALLAGAWLARGRLVRRK